jgi:hypothetical protein
MNLEQYKELLDLNTNVGMCRDDISKSRYHSFKKCLEYLGSIENPEVLELGTSHSYVSGQFEGCDVDDPKYWNPNDFSKWDFGAGVFTLIFGQSNFQLTTVDLNPVHIKRCKVMTDSLNIKCNHIVSDSTKFLSETNKTYDLIYLDTGYLDKETEILQLRESKIIVERNLLKPTGWILLDDVLNATPRNFGDLSNKYGRAEKSLPYFLSNNFKIIFEGYQYILTK